MKIKLVDLLSAIQSIKDNGFWTWNIATSECVKQIERSGVVWIEGGYTIKEIGANVELDFAIRFHETHTSVEVKNFSSTIAEWDVDFV